MQKNKRIDSFLHDVKKCYSILETNTSQIDILPTKILIVLYFMLIFYFTVFFLLGQKMIIRGKNISLKSTYILMLKSLFIIE